MPETKPHVRVVVGMLVQPDRYYVQKRPFPGLRAGLWELPGGKQIVGETDEETLARELAEELSITHVSVGGKLAECFVEYAETTCNVALYHVAAWNGTPKPPTTVASEHAWVVGEALIRLADKDCVPSMHKLLEETFFGRRAP